jgi:small multidrug resistance family-3 protein
MTTISLVARSVSLFVLAGACEIGGRWLVWKWLRDHRPGWWGLLGGLVLVTYGIIPTFQASHFGRVYAVYGGFFIVLSLVWGWRIDGDRPDKADVIGSLIALVGVRIMMYWPRR